MAREHDDALEEFLAAFDRRLKAAPVIDRRDRSDRRSQPPPGPVEGQRVDGPASDPFAYWEQKDAPEDDPA